MDGDASIIWAEMMGGRAPLLTVLGGDDDINGSKFEEILHGYAGDEVIRGLGGFDTIYGNSGNDWLYGGSGDDVLRGGNGNDYVNGDTGADRLEGGQGHDHLHGGVGKDILTGGIGKDYLDSDNGDDTMMGGAGEDRLFFFTFGGDNAGGADVITDFEVGDTIFLGRVSRDDMVEVTQTGDDVVITLSDAAVTNSITPLDALDAEVSAALTISYVYY